MNKKVQVSNLLVVNNVCDCTWKQRDDCNSQLETLTKRRSCKRVVGIIWKYVSNLSADFSKLEDSFDIICVKFRSDIITEISAD